LPAILPGRLEGPVARVVGIRERRIGRTDVARLGIDDVAQLGLDDVAGGRLAQPLAEGADVVAPAQPLEDLLVVVEGVLLPAGELVPAEGLRGSRRRGGRVLRPGDDAPSGVPALAVELLGGIPLLDGGDV